MAGSMMAGVMEFFREYKEEILNYSIYPYIILSIFVFLIFGRIKSFNQRSIDLGIDRKILIVTAHPDDECMFMSPLLLSLCGSGHFVYVLCLTTGMHNLTF